jgi:hypothetical protein
VHSQNQTPAQIKTFQNAIGLVCGHEHLLALPYARVSITAQTLYDTSQRSQLSTYFVNGSTAAWVDPAVAFEQYRVPPGYFNNEPTNSQAVVCFVSLCFSFRFLFTLEL